MKLSEIDSDTGKAQKLHESAAPNEEIGVHTQDSMLKKTFGACTTERGRCEI
jgi:hypothetical protein